MADSAEADALLPLTQQEAVEQRQETRDAANRPSNAAASSSRETAAADQLSAQPVESTSLIEREQRGDVDATASLLSSKSGGLPSSTHSHPSQMDTHADASSGVPYRNGITASVPSSHNTQSSHPYTSSPSQSSYFTFGDFPHGPTLESGGAIFNAIDRPIRDARWGRAFLIVLLLLAIREAAWFFRALMSLSVFLPPDLAYAEFLGLLVGTAAAGCALLGTAWAVRRISPSEMERGGSGDAHRAYGIGSKFLELVSSGQLSSVFRRGSETFLKARMAQVELS